MAERLSRTGPNLMAADKKGRITEEQRRRERLAGQLRQNLQRRKAQARARRSGDADARPEGLDAASSDMPATDQGSRDEG